MFLIKWNQTYPSKCLNITIGLSFIQFKRTLILRKGKWSCGKDLSLNTLRVRTSMWLPLMNSMIRPFVKIIKSIGDLRWIQSFKFANGWSKRSLLITLQLKSKRIKSLCIGDPLKISLRPYSSGLKTLLELDQLKLS